MKLCLFKKTSWLGLFIISLIPIAGSSQTEEKPIVLFILCNDLNDYDGCYNSNPDAPTVCISLFPFGTSDLWANNKPGTQERHDALAAIVKALGHRNVQSSVVRICSISSG